jgi:hypothetical protein
MTKEPPVLKRVSEARPCANDLLRGWHDAEAGIPYQRTETEDWKTGWTLWYHQEGQRWGSWTRH